MKFKLTLIALAAVACTGCVEESYYTESTQTDMYYTNTAPSNSGYRSSHAHQTVVTQSPTVVYSTSRHHDHPRAQSVEVVTQTPPAPPADYRSASMRSAAAVTQTPAAPSEAPPSTTAVTQTPPAPVEAAPAPVATTATTVTPAAPSDDSDKEKPATVASNSDVTVTPQAPE